MHFFAEQLRQWYRANRRDLPWRATKDPYRIWLSEIIMQQTQVAQGLAYYLRFVDHYPDVTLLAKAPADEVMKHWQGLGYYSRARNLHQTAKFIASEHRGKFPATYAAIRSLKGVGDYTAAAIGSIAFGLPHAVVDGNVYRVLSRVFGIDTPIDSTAGKKQFQELAQSLLPENNPGDHNQAVMEFGAMHCRPVNPDCGSCIFREKCAAYAAAKVADLPVKAKKTKVRNRYFNYIVCSYRDEMYLSKREHKDIWQGLYEFHLVETKKKMSAAALLKQNELAKVVPLQTAVVKKVSKEYKHVLSHQNLYARFYALELKKPLRSKQLVNVKLADIHRYAFPRLIEKYLKEEKVIN